MKFLNFDFGHPFKGHANLLQLATATPNHHTVSINSKKGNLLQVPIGNCSNGKWRLTLDWEYEGGNYFHEEEFEVKK
jgi:hypothetical protein